MENEQARIELAAAHRGLDHYRLNEGVNNHISLRTKVCSRTSNGIFHNPP